MTAPSAPEARAAAASVGTLVDRANAALEGTDGTLTGVTAVDRDFLHALFGSFPYVLALVLACGVRSRTGTVSRQRPLTSFRAREGA